jgi:hypothetical protein
MFAWVEDGAVDVSREARPIMKTGSSTRAQQTQLEQLQAFYTALGAFSMTVRGQRCCVYRSAELCTLLNRTMGGRVATADAMLRTILTEYMALMAVLESIRLCKRRLSTILLVLSRQTFHGKHLFRQINPTASSPCAFRFLDYIADSYRTALDRFLVYNEIVEHHLQDIKSIVDYMHRPTHDPANAGIMWDAIVSMVEACSHQRAKIELLITTCRHQVSPDVIASQLRICNEHMCSSLELYASVFHQALACCGRCAASASTTLYAEPCCTRCVHGLRGMLRSIESELR